MHYTGNRVPFGMYSLTINSRLLLYSWASHNTPSQEVICIHVFIIQLYLDLLTSLGVQHRLGKHTYVREDQ